MNLLEISEQVYSHALGHMIPYEAHLEEKTSDSETRTTLKNEIFYDQHFIGEDGLFDLNLTSLSSSNDEFMMQLNAGEELVSASKPALFFKNLIDIGNQICALRQALLVFDYDAAYSICKREFLNKRSYAGGRQAELWDVYERERLIGLHEVDNKKIIESLEDALETGGVKRINGRTAFDDIQTDKLIEGEREKEKERESERNSELNPNPPFF